MIGSSARGARASERLAAGPAACYRERSGDSSPVPHSERMDPEALFAGRSFALSVVERVETIIASIGESTMRTTKSQIAFRRRRGFAYLWPPVFGNRGVEIVLSIALGRPDSSPRFKQVAHPAPHVWMHHMEIRDLAQLDDQVEAWLREAFDNAS